MSDTRATLEDEALQAYIGDLRGAWAGDPGERPERCAEAMRRFLRCDESAPWVKRIVESEDGRVELYQDPEYGFIQLAHRYGPDHRTAPHNHGPGWVVYGVYRGNVRISTYREVAGDGQPALETATDPVVRAGEANPYLTGVIHSTDAQGPGDSIVLRFLSQDLSGVKRARYSWAQIR